MITKKEIYYVPFNDFNNSWYKDLQGKYLDKIVPYCIVIKQVIEVENNEN
ncbi:hypothetical protein [Geminocystis herdmanii]|nr:hypothetical protein [Geminocystis herdmanii]